MKRGIEGRGEKERKKQRGNVENAKGKKPRKSTKAEQSGTGQKRSKAKREVIQSKVRKSGGVVRNSESKMMYSDGKKKKWNKAEQSERDRPFGDK